MSSIGSIISLLGVVMFIIVLWEAIVLKSSSVGYSVSSSLEWRVGVPPMDHTFNQLALLLK